MKKLNGITASPGIAIGVAVLHQEAEFPEIHCRKIEKDQIENELKRYKLAVEEAITETKALYERAVNEMGKENSDIFAAHLMMLEDDDFQEQITGRLRETEENIEWVVYDTAQALIRTMESSPDTAFRERAADVNDVSRRVLSRLLSIERVSLSDLDYDAIVVARDLLPSETLTMNRRHVKGIVMDMGGPTSHVAILARSFNIPTVLGLTSATSEIKNGETLIVDAEAGEVYVAPNDKDLEKWQKAEVKYQMMQDSFLHTSDLPAETKDGHRVSLKANIGIPEEAEALARFGAEGIGLFRSEFLFLDRGEAVGEEYQLNAYSRVLKVMGNLPVTIRTVDIGGDKILPEFHKAEEKNPLLGWRAIRFSLSMPGFFKTQLRAILRASVNGNVKIMFPMVSGIEELDEALGLLEEAKSECRKKKQPFADDIEVGVMIEVPAAAMTADIIAKKSNFFSIGTNDLIQYSLAVDRGNEKVSYLAQALHPAVLRFIKTAIHAAHERGIKAAMCGEMAGNSGVTALLLGLGLDEFSMTAASIPNVKHVIREVNISACRKLAIELLQGGSFMANNALMEAWMAEMFPERKPCRSRLQRQIQKG